MTKPKPGLRRAFNWRAKAALVCMAISGGDIRAVLSEHEISHEEFNGWCDAYKAGGVRGLKINANRKRKSPVAS